MNAFSYGTLLFPEIVQRLLGRDATAEWVTLRNYKRCRILDPERQAKGPAIVPCFGSDVRGRLLDVSDDEWRILDRFENFAGGYVPTELSVFADDGQTRRARAYVAGEDLRSVVGQEWSELEFSEKWLNHYLEERIPGFLADLEDAD